MSCPKHMQMEMEEREEANSTQSLPPTLQEINAEIHRKLAEATRLLRLRNQIRAKGGAGVVPPEG